MGIGSGSGTSLDELTADAVAFDNSAPVFTESNPENVQEAIAASGEGIGVALNTPRYAIILQYNGSVAGNTFLGYSNLIPGNTTPIVIPVKSELIEYTFSNTNSNADYAIEIRRNSTTGTVLDTESVDNTQFYFKGGLSIAFEAGDTIFIKYIDQGTNANDVGLVLFFKAVPE